jgi:hypothetical protein
MYAGGQIMGFICSIIDEKAYIKWLSEVNKQEFNSCSVYMGYES